LPQRQSPMCISEPVFQFYVVITLARKTLDSLFGIVYCEIMDAMSWLRIQESGERLVMASNDIARVALCYNCNYILQLDHNPRFGPQGALVMLWKPGLRMVLLSHPSPGLVEGAPISSL